MIEQAMADDPHELKRKMLAVLAQRYPMKFTRTQLGTLAGYTASGGTGKAEIGKLKVENGRRRLSAFAFLLSAFPRCAAANGGCSTS